MSVFSVSGIGALMAVYGLLSSALYYFGYNLRIILWIDSWGEHAGWIIRAAFILIGFLLYLLAKKPAKRYQIRFPNN